MTSQNVQATAFSSSGGRSFSVSSTDGSFSNRLVTDVGSAQIGFGMTNELVDRIQIQYAAGGAAWRLLDSVSQVTLRVGFGFLAGSKGPAPYSGKIAPIVIGQNQVLEVYTVAVPT